MNNPSEGPQSPGQVLVELLKKKGWTQVDLATILNKPQRSISEIVTGKKAVTPETAVQLAQAFGNDAEFWLQLEGRYRLSLLSSPASDVEKRAKLFEIAPIKEMVKRGWISASEDLGQLERELCRFFDQSSLDQDPQIGVSLRSSITGDINVAQKAWCYRARNLAKGIKVEVYDDSALDRGIARLRRLAAWPEHVAKVSQTLANIGIRFVVVEPLANSRIDGAAFWLDETSPVVAMSNRFDRIDSFWHTLGHELSHIRHRDGTVVDIDIVGENRPSPVELSAIERRADQEASAMWIDQEELNSFIVRVGPLYSRERINQFANRMKIHPGIIVGQLQYRGELGYQNLRDTLVKVREHLTFDALTDGWGQVISSQA